MMLLFALLLSYRTYTVTCGPDCVTVRQETLLSGKPTEFLTPPPTPVFRYHDPTTPGRVCGMWVTPTPIREEP